MTTTKTKLATRPAVALSVVMMDESEAREALQRMSGDLEQADVSIASFRQRALDFKEREGWRALGYGGVMEAINAELGTQYSKSYLSRLLKAAEIERVLELPIGNNTPESRLRPLGDLDSPDDQREAWQRANERSGGKPTAKVVQTAADDVAAFEDARRRFAALGWKLERHGAWYKLSAPNGDHYATTQELAPQLDTLRTFEADVVRRAREATPPAIEQPAPLPPLPTAPAGWTVYRIDVDRIGLKHRSGYRLGGAGGIDAAALIAEAESLTRYLDELHAGDWRVFYDPACPPELNAYTATHDAHQAIAAHDLPHLALLAWRARQYESDLPDWPDALIDALYLAGERIQELAAQDMPIAQLYYLAGLAPALAPEPTTTCERCHARAAVRYVNCGGCKEHRCMPCGTLPHRPRRPLNRGSSAVLDYLHEMEEYATALETALGIERGRT